MKVFCINIDNDTESWRLSQEQFNSVGLPVQRISAIVEDNRVLAFNKSVYKAMLATAQQITHPNNPELSKTIYDSLLLFEDDVMFDGYIQNDRSRFIDAYRELPGNWMTLHLGANIIGTDLTQWQMPESYSRNLAKLHNCFQSHATLYSEECVKFIIDNFKYVTDEYKTEGCMIFDEWVRLNVLSQGRSYVIKPMIAYQRPRRSEIWNCDADYTGAHKQGNEYLKTLQ